MARQRGNSFLVVLALVLCLMAAPRAFGGAETITITSLDWPPYASALLDDGGQAVAKLRAILERKGVVLEVVFHPWDIARREARRDKYAGYFPAWPEEVEDGFVASGPIDYSEINVVYRPDGVSSERTIGELFERQKVGLVKSYDYPDDITRLADAYHCHIVYVPSDFMLMRMLYAGRFRAGITDIRVAAYISERDGLPAPVAGDWYRVQRPLVIAVQAGKAEYLRKLLTEIE